MANRFEVSIDVEVSPDAAWAVVGDPANIGWFPPVATCEVTDGVRHVVLTDGGKLVERIVEHDDAARSYSYSVVEGTATKLTSHLASLSVEARGGGSRVTWRTDAEPEDPDVDLERRLSGVMSKGLGNLKSLLEGRTG